MNSEPSFGSSSSGAPKCLNPVISDSAISHALNLYFERVHRQPIWCFDRHDIRENIGESPELVYSLLGLTARFIPDRDSPQYCESARWAIMLRVANDTVELETIESLCLLSFSAFIGE